MKMIGFQDDREVGFAKSSDVFKGWSMGECSVYFCKIGTLQKIKDELGINIEYKFDPNYDKILAIIIM